MTSSEESTEERLPSKSQIKRECEALRKLGEELIALKAQDLDNMELPEDLDTAVRTARKLQSRGGLKRQRQYIGKLMRQVDSEAIAQQLDKIRHRHDTNTATFRKLESWRDRLLANDKSVLGEIIESHTDVDRQHIHQLVRQAEHEQQQEKPPAAARKLFKYLVSLEG